MYGLSCVDAGPEEANKTEVEPERDREKDEGGRKAGSRWRGVGGKHIYKYIYAMSHVWRRWRERGPATNDPQASGSRWLVWRFGETTPSLFVGDPGSQSTYR